MPLGAGQGGGGVRCLGLEDRDFPAPLRGLYPALWLAGQVEALKTVPAVTVVGSRAASARGLARAQALGRALAKHGALVVSGGALGIDAAAHRGALEAGGRTCAVLGTGVDVCYPACHGELFAAIAKDGCLLSMLPPGSLPLRGHFPRRNQLMAALGELLIVVEAQLPSGTSYTARAAKKCGRRVLCFTDSPGTVALAQAGAQPVSSVEDVLACLPAAAAARPAERALTDLAAQPLSAASQSQEELLPLAPASQRLLGALSPAPFDLGELCARTGLSAAECAAAVIELELRGQCSRLPGGRYVGHSPPG